MNFGVKFQYLAELKYPILIADMSSLLLYATLSVAFGFIGILTTPGYNPSFDFGIALILLGLYRRGSNNGET